MLKKCLAVVLALLLAAGLLNGCDAIQNMVQTASAYPGSSEYIQGQVNGQTYMNPATGLSITYPDGYKVFDYSQKTEFLTEDKPVSSAFKISDMQSIKSNFNIIQLIIGVRRQKNQ
ncbi:MAG: hypothetical protein WCP73_05730 [Eubacteriales bacterium]